MVDTTTFRRVAGLAARELFLGTLKTIEETCRTVIDAIDPEGADDTDGGVCDCGVTHDGPYAIPLAGVLAAFRNQAFSAPPAPDSDRPWSITTAGKITPGYDVRLNTGEELHVLEVGQTAFDANGDQMVPLQVLSTDSCGPQLLRIGVDTPLLAAPRIPDDLSEVTT